MSAIDFVASIIKGLMVAVTVRDNQHVVTETREWDSGRVWALTAASGKLPSNADLSPWADEKKSNALVRGALEVLVSKHGGPMEVALRDVVQRMLSKLHEGAREKRAIPPFARPVPPVPQARRRSQHDRGTKRPGVSWSQKPSFGHVATSSHFVRQALGKFPGTTVVTLVIPSLAQGMEVPQTTFHVGALSVRVVRGTSTHLASEDRQVVVLLQPLSAANAYGGDAAKTAKNHAKLQRRTSRLTNLVAFRTMCAGLEAKGVSFVAFSLTAHVAEIDAAFATKAVKDLVRLLNEAGGAHDDLVRAINKALS